MCIYIYIYIYTSYIGGGLALRPSRAPRSSRAAPVYTILYYTILYYTTLHYTIPYLASARGAEGPLRRSALGGFPCGDPWGIKSTNNTTNNTNAPLQLETRN